MKLIIGILLIFLNLISNIMNYQNCIKANLTTCNFFGNEDIFYCIGFNFLSIIGIFLIFKFIKENIKYKPKFRKMEIKNKCNLKKNILYLCTIFIIIFLGGIAIYEYNIISSNNKKSLQDCYQQVENRYTSISDIFQTNCFEVDVPYKQTLCSYPNSEDHIKLNLLKSDDMEKCRNWFSK